MTREFENMLRLFGCGALGKEPAAAWCENLRIVRSLAQRQQIWPVVYSAVLKKLKSGEVLLPDEIKASLETEYTLSIAKNLQRTEFNHATLKELSQSGVACCILKGSTLAKLYALPETRISSDTDALIDPSDEKKAIEVLKGLGYSVVLRESRDYEIKATHKVGGLLELHVGLMYKSSDDIIFENCISFKEPRIKNEDGTYTLGINDALLFTAAHFIKHFVRTGAGVRQIMDLLLYMKKYEDKADWQRFNTVMEKLRYGCLINAVKSIGVRYWGMEFKDFTPVDTKITDALLTDIENGGVFGKDEKDRMAAYNFFAKKRKNMTDGEYEKYRLNNPELPFLKKLFPEPNYVKKVYPWAGKNIVLLIFAYIKRYFSVAGGLISGKRNLQKTIYGETQKTPTEQTKKRIELMQALDIID